MTPSHTKASNAFCKSLNSFLATAVDDMHICMHIYIFCICDMISSSMTLLPHIKTSNALCKSLESFLATSLDDMHTRIHIYIYTVYVT